MMTKKRMTRAERRAKERRIAERQADEERKLRRIFKRGMYPLNAPGMPGPGPDFLREALAMGDETIYQKGTKKKEQVFEPGPALDTLYKRALREPGFNIGVKVREGIVNPVTFVPGHIWNQHAEEWGQSLADPDIEIPHVDGPHPAEVMILGKMPWNEETEMLRNLVGPSGEILTELTKKFHIKNAGSWYVTNLVKFTPPTQSSSLKAGWIQDCLPLLHQELRIVRPKYILCLGADASNALLGKNHGVGYMAGRVVPYTFQLDLERKDKGKPKLHTSHVMTVLHPAEVARSPEKIRILESNFGRFATLLQGKDFTLEEKDLDHRVCYDLETAEAWAQEAELEMKKVPARLKLVGIDLEWQGQHPVNEGSYVRTIQVSWAEKKSICFVLRKVGGKMAFFDRNGKPAIKRLVKILNVFMRKKRAVMHFGVSDLEFARSIGFDPVADNPVPLFPLDGKAAWQRLRCGEGWLDTAYMNHAIEETAPLGLETLAMRFTSCPRYDIALEDWKKAYCAAKKLKGETLDGYGECPDEVLCPYGNYDADVTRRCALYFLGLLDKDFEGNCSWEACWESMIAQPVILDIHENGICVDRKRIDDLTKKFITARAAKEEEIKNWAKWPEFNIRSVQQVREFLFGEQYNGKLSENGEVVRLRPEGAKSLRIAPLLDTSKPPRRWSDLVEKGMDREATPGTGKMILGILAQDLLAEDDKKRSRAIGRIRDYRFLDQVLKSILRVPKVDEEDRWVEDEFGNLEYEQGLAASIDDDGRVRTHCYATAETGRWKHSRPNLANISKSRDDDYIRLLGGTKNEKGKWVGGLYDHKLRSVLVASPGWCFIEFDYKGAELYGMALMSGSKRMREHCERALLDEKDPKFYDIHSNVAVMAFKLSCAPTKKDLEDNGYGKFRTLAKNVIFGIAYGRGAKAIALSARENGINVTPDDAQKVIDAIFAMYPELVPFFETAKSRAITEKFLGNCFGRWRRFPSVSDFKMEGEFERQAMNFPIQSMIASAVDRGLAYLRWAIYDQGLQNDIRILLQMHDAGLVECRPEMVPHAMKIIQWAMVDMVPIWPTDLAGKTRGDGPYHLGLDFSVEKAWSEKFSQQEAAEIGLDLAYAKA